MITMIAELLVNFKDTRLTLVYSAIILCVAWFMRPVLRGWWLVWHIPGPRSVPFVGNFLPLALLNTETIHEKFCDWHRKYGPLVGLQVFHKIIVSVNNPGDAQTIMMNPTLRDRDPLFEMLGNTYVKGSMIVLRDKEWLARRKLVNTSFQFKIVVTYLEKFNKKAQDCADSFASVADGRIVNLNKHLSLCTMSGIIETGIGIEDDIWKEELVTLKQCLDMAVDFAAARMVNPLVWLDWTYELTTMGKAARKKAKWTQDFVDKLVAKVYAEFARSGSKKDSVISAGSKKLQSYTDIVLEAAAKEGNFLPAKHVRNDIILLAAGGTESCASVMSYVLMLVGIHPGYQDRLVEEQRAIFGDSLRPVTHDDITKMPLLEMVLKETLRLFPPFPVAPRYIPFEIPIANGNILPAGALAAISIYNIHHDPVNYVDPDRFWPERWLPENSVGRHPYSYIPYGAGGRNCVAIKYTQLQMKATLSRVLRQFRFTNEYTMGDLGKIGFGPINKALRGYDSRITFRDPCDT